MEKDIPAENIRNVLATGNFNDCSVLIFINKHKYVDVCRFIMCLFNYLSIYLFKRFLIQIRSIYVITFCFYLAQ